MFNAVLERISLRPTQLLMPYKGRVFVDADRKGVFTRLVFCLRWKVFFVFFWEDVDIAVRGERGEGWWYVERDSVVEKGGLDIMDMDG